MIDELNTVLSVSQITQMLKSTISEAFYGLCVEGEVSGFKMAPTGHWYFTLKDSSAVINAAVWKSTASRLNFVPKDGQKVVVKGSIDIYEPRGTYSIICSSVRLMGEGDILLKLEEKKRYYEKLGYFKEERKKPIPKRPAKVAVITSSTGAALQDILQITERRASGMDVIILPTLVQGEEAAKEIALRIAQVNTFGLADVMIVGRGGGSIEDLLPFSEDCVIEAIYRSQIPVISAVGHEIDWALSDYVADLRAPTPSAAAELVCQDQDDTLEKFRTIVEDMKNCIKEKIDAARRVLETNSVLNSTYLLESRLSNARMRLDNVIDDLSGNLERKAFEKRSDLEVLTSTLKALSPLAVLDRGYAIVSYKDKTLKDASAVKVGEGVKITLKKGKITATVNEVN